MVTQSFSLKSLSAFDDLMENGISIEIEHRESESYPDIGNFRYISLILLWDQNVYLSVIGLRVELDCTAMTWDGASTITNKFTSGRVGFIVGQDQITSGLDLAVQQLKKGDKVICLFCYRLFDNPWYRLSSLADQNWLMEQQVYYLEHLYINLLLF